MASAPPPMAPSRPPTCGSAPDRKPRRTASTTSRMAMRSNGFTARDRRTGRRNGRRSPGRDQAATALSRRRPRRPGRCRSRRGSSTSRARTSGIVEPGPVLLGDGDAGDLAGTASLAEGDGERAVAGIDEDRVERAEHGSTPLVQVAVTTMVDPSTVASKRSAATGVDIELAGSRHDERRRRGRRWGRRRPAGRDGRVGSGRARRTPRAPTAQERAAMAPRPKPAGRVADRPCAGRRSADEPGSGWPDVEVDPRRR